MISFYFEILKLKRINKTKTNDNMETKQNRMRDYKWKIEYE